MSASGRGHRLNAAAAGAVLTLAASLALLLLPQIATGAALELRDLLPLRGAQDLGPSTQRIGAVALVSLLVCAAAAPLVAPRPVRRVLLPVAAALLLAFCLLTILYNGLLYLPGAAALAIAANRQRRQSVSRPSQ